MRLLWLWLICLDFDFLPATCRKNQFLDVPHSVSAQEIAAHLNRYGLVVLDLVRGGPMVAAAALAESDQRPRLGVKTEKTQPFECEVAHVVVMDKTFR